MTQNSPHNNHIEEIPFLRSSQEHIKSLLSRNPLSYEVDRKYYKKLVWLNPPPSHDILLIRYFLSRFNFKQFDAPDSYFTFRYFYPRQESLHVTVHKKKHECTIKAHLDIIEHKEGCSNELTFELLSSLNFFLRREYPTSLFYLKSLRHINQERIDAIKRFLDPREVPNEIINITSSADTPPLKPIEKEKKTATKSPQISVVVQNPRPVVVRKPIQKRLSHPSRKKRFAKPLVIKNTTLFTQENPTEVAPSLPQKPIISLGNNEYKKCLENHNQLELNQKYDDMEHYLEELNEILEEITQEPIAHSNKDIQIGKQEPHTRKNHYPLIYTSSYCLKFCRQTVEKEIKPASHANLPKVFVRLKLKAAYFCMVERVDMHYRNDCLQHLNTYLQNHFNSDYKTFRNRHHPRMTPLYILKVLYANRAYVLTSTIFSILAVVVGCQFYSLSAFEKRYLFETRGELVFLLIIFMGLAIYYYCRLFLSTKRILKSAQESKL